MQPGDLRRFNDTFGGAFDGLFGHRLVGCTFMVLEVKDNHPGGGGGSVKRLIDGRVDEGWSHLWVLENSEALNEAR